MLAFHENALIAALANHRDIKPKVRTVESLPRLFGEKLLQRYVADAPALYVVPGRITMKDDEATLEFTVAGVVRNVAGHAQARKGDGVDIGCDHLLVLALRAINAQCLGKCSWSATSAEMADDEVFEKAGISAVEIKFISSRVALDADFGEAQLAELADFTHFHADIDSPADAGEIEYASWLQEPPTYPNGQPDLRMDVSLPGATA
ncbi:MAG: DUF1834 family protein [Burkholderiaceae bacterium]|nr:DUF1834 family protein [Burkholderiaceae bacterium]